MKRKLLFMAVGLILVLSQANAYTTENLVSDGWSLVSNLSDNTDNVYVFVDADSESYAMSWHVGNASGRPVYIEFPNPLTSPGIVWTIETRNDGYAIRNIISQNYFNSGAEGWDDDMQSTYDSGSFSFNFDNPKYNLRSITVGGDENYVGPWEDGGHVILSEGIEGVAANKSLANAPGFKIYKMAKATFAKKYLQSTPSLTAPVDMSFLIVNPTIYQGGAATDLPWGWSNFGEHKTGDNKYTYETGNTILQGWVRGSGTITLDFDYYQGISNLPGGKYKIQAYGKGSPTRVNSFLYICQDATKVSQELNNNEFQNFETGYLAVSDGTNITFGIEAEGSHNAGLSEHTAESFGDDFCLKVDPYLSTIATTEFTSGSTLTAGLWYYIDIASTDEYDLTSSEAITLSFATGAKTLSEASTVALTADKTKAVDFEAGRLYLKANVATTLTLTLAQAWTGNTATAGTFYLYNVGAGKFLNVGDPNQDWGTNAWLSTNSGFDVTLEASGDKFKINTNVSNGGDDHYLSNSTWCDAAAVDWQFRAVAGETKVYQIIYNGQYLMANAALDDVEMVGDPGARTTSTYWILVTKADRIAALAYASPSNPMDASFLITGANFSRNNGRNDAWTQTKSGGENKLVLGGNNRNWCFESYHTNNFEVKQAVTGAPAGKYGLKIQGFYRKDSGDSGRYPYLYLNDSKVTLPLKTGSENSHSAASDAFSAGKYFSDEIKYSYTTGDFNVGTKLEDNGWLWTTFDNFVLTYYGNDCSDKIADANFEGSKDDWSGTKPTQNNGNGEHYSKTYDMYQNITGLDAGIYAVEVQGFYRQGDEGTRGRNEENQNASIYAKGQDDVERSVKLLSIYDAAGQIGSVGTKTVHGYIPNSQSEGASYFGAGLYSNNKVLVEVGAAGTLTVGLKKSTAVTYDWTLFDNFSLTKLPYASLAGAYAAEWTSKKAEAIALQNSDEYSNILTTAAVYTALSSAIAATPSTIDTYISALAALRTAVNGFKAAKYAYDVYADGNTSAYEHIAGEERTTFESIDPTSVSDVYTKAPQFVSAKIPYDEYYYEKETATRLGADASGVSVPTTAAAATTAAHEINVINYAKFVAEEYEDVSETVLGDWTDDNVGSMTGQHWSGNGSEPYFEQKDGYYSASVWTMSRQQTISLAAGSYVLKVAARVSSGADAQLSVTVGAGDPIVTYAPHHGDSGKGIDTAGDANFGEGTFANTSGRGFEWRYIPFTVASTGDVTLKFSAVNTSGNVNQYVSFCDLGIWTDPKVAARTLLLTAINNATSARKSANEGTGIFQIPAAAGTTLASAITTAQGVYDNSEATLEQINGATTTMAAAQATYEATTLNAPSSSTRYKLVLANLGTLSFDASGAADEGGYGLPFKAAANYMAQTFFLTQQGGNNYKMSFEDFEGTTRYICTAENAKAGEGNIKIRTTTDASKALVIKMTPTATANVFKMLNTAESDRTIGSNGGGLYTANENTLWSISEAAQASVAVTLSAGKYGTRIFPFTPSAIDGVTYYSCATVAGSELTLSPVAEPEANTPYILYASKNVDETLEGWGTASTTSYESGLLTGIYNNTTIAADAHNYVLQTLNDVQAFYLVKENFTNTQPYRAYITYEASPEVKALNFVFDELPTAINAVEAAQNENAVIYNLAGQRLNKAQKGVNIINGKKVLVK